MTSIVCLMEEMTLHHSDMKAIVLNRSIPEGIELIDLPKPKLNSGEVLVQIKASALNHRDEWCRIGQYANLRDGIILGSDGAGIVVEVADDSDLKWIGKEVILNPALSWGDNQLAQSKTFEIIGMPNHGTLAQYIAVPASRIHEKPSHLSLEQAAALPLAGVTAYRALVFQGQVKAGEKVLITGIGGGVAQFAFQFASALGAEVSVSSSKQEKLDFALENGAKFGFDYTQKDWVKKALDATGGFDLIIDGAAGDSLNDLIQVVKPGGRIVFYGATCGNPSELVVRRIFWNQIKLIGSTMGSDLDFANMLQLVKDQKIKPVIDQVFDLEEAVSAFDRMKNGQQLGKIVIRP
jgi:zinc-binding alcohol dehydrogenase/oxidoreductase